MALNLYLGLSGQSKHCQGRRGKDLNENNGFKHQDNKLACRVDLSRAP